MAIATSSGYTKTAMHNADLRGLTARRRAAHHASIVPGSWDKGRRAETAHRIAQAIPRAAVDLQVLDLPAQPHSAKEQ